MMTLYDHIQQLRAELSNSCDRAEFRQIRTELEAALAEQEKLDVTFEAWLTSLE
jgi:hypothetical protein